MEVRPVQAAAHPRRNPWWIWCKLSILSAVLIYLIARKSTLAEVSSARDYSVLADKTVAISLAGGFCLAMPFACLWVNRPLWRAMLRRTKGKVIAAALLATFAPIAIHGLLPIALGFLALLSFIGIMVEPLTGKAWMDFFLVQSSMIVAFAIAYPLASAVIYGLPKRWRPVVLVLFVIGLDLLFSLFGWTIRPSLYL
jgi:hypothetical protein